MHFSSAHTLIAKCIYDLHVAKIENNVHDIWLNYDKGSLLLLVAFLFCRYYCYT